MMTWQSSRTQTAFPNKRIVSCVSNAFRTFPKSPITRIVQPCLLDCRCTTRARYKHHVVAQLVHGISINTRFETLSVFSCDCDFLLP
jgi:hypothetical protein